jgi:SAM-dependent methyltransferase
MTSEPTASTRTPQGSPPDLADRLEAVWQLAAVARALGGDSDALLTGLSAAVADAAGSTLPGWDPDDDTLTTQGRASRRVADLITDVVAGRFPELADHLAAPGARFLDVGVGVAQISIELCRRYPLLQVTGVDINARPLRLAADNVAAADLNDRIDLRQADIAELADAESFTLAWIPMPFLSPGVVRPALSAVHRALRPGGWLLAGCSGQDTDTLANAMNRLRAGILGGGHHTAADTAALLIDLGFTDVHQLPAAPAGPPGLVVARKPSSDVGR